MSFWPNLLKIGVFQFTYGPFHDLFYIFKAKLFALEKFIFFFLFTTTAVSSPTLELENALQ